MDCTNNPSLGAASHSHSTTDTLECLPWT